MPDYQKGKIYKLWSPQGNEIYIGSTINSLAKRLNHHKSYLKYTSKYLFENYDVVKIELIEEYPCNNKMELVKKEGEHIRNNTCLNKVIPDRTRKEYNEEYYENNKENINEKRSEKIECDCGGKYTQGHKSHHFKTKKHTKFMNSQQEQQPRK
jgi:Uri superfamily endonuclease